MSAEADPINNFETNVVRVRPSDRRSRAKGRDRRALPRRPNHVGPPTLERLAKPDAPVRMDAGHYRAPMPIERMRDREQLAPGDAQLNEALFQAAEKLVGLFEGACLATTVRAQDLTRVIGGAGDNGDHHAAHCLLEFQQACTLMGWSVAHPHRGAGRLAVAVVCFGQSVSDAAALHWPGNTSEFRRGAGMDALREGLFTLALHWRLARG